VYLSERKRSEFHDLRAQARTQLGDFAGAIRDTNVYLRWLQTDFTSRNIAQIAVLRVKFETALEEQELGRMSAEARAAKLAASRQSLATNVIGLSAALIVSTSLFGTWLWRRRREIEHVKQTAQQRLAAIGQLTGGIAHDFNNHLSVILQGIWMLASQSSIKGDPTAVNLLNGIERTSTICADITSQLLSFARQQNLKPEAIQMNAFLVAVLPALKQALGAASTIQIAVESPEPKVWADRRQLTSALLNLIVNARDAMHQGGTVSMRVGHGAPHAVLITMADDGCGMTPEVLAHAIEPFYTTKPVGCGSGLGLSMVQGFATQSGGTLEIASEPTRGTTVSLRLPAAEASE